MPVVSDREPYSYRVDPAVPEFADDRPVVIFDGHCVFCSGWARFILAHDRQGRFRLLPAQSKLGAALYRHYQLDAKDYETNILLLEGRAWLKSQGTLKMFQLLGFPWSMAGVFRILPAALLDPVYEFVARNRFRIAGRREVCFMPEPGYEDRFLE